MKVSVYDMNREQYIKALASKTTPDRLFDNAGEIYAYLSGLFQEDIMDSVIREWSFQWYSETTGINYDKIYDRWLNVDPTTTDDAVFVRKFAETLEEKGGDTFFSTGEFDEDVKLIKGTIDAQGYWAGTQYRYFFDKKYNFLKLEERQFGVS